MTDQLDDDAVDRLVDEFDESVEELDDDRELADTEPGAAGPAGTGVEGADDILEAERRAAESDDPHAESVAAGFASGMQDPQTAAEQGNRPGDEMVSEGMDGAEVQQLAGDDLTVDALADETVQFEELDNEPTTEDQLDYE